MDIEAGTQTTVSQSGPEAADGGRVEGMLRALSEGTAATIGEGFFKSLAMHLAAAFQARYAFVAACTDESRTRVRTLAFWKGDSFAENVEYPVAATPCKHVVDGNVLHHADAVRELYPLDQDLHDLGARSYLGVPVPDASGNVIGHIAVLDDKPREQNAGDVWAIKVFATRAGSEMERQRAEAALRESEARFRSGFYDALIGMAMAGEGGRFSSVNKALCDMLGYTEVELLATDFQTISHPDDAATSAQLAFDLTSGRRDSFQREMRYRHKNGQTVWAITSASVVRTREGQPRYFYAQVQDITVRKLAEEELKSATDELEQRVRQRTDELSATNASLQDEILERRRIADALKASEGAYRDFYMDAPNVYISTGVDGLIKRANQRAAELFGYELDVFVGKPVLSLVADTKFGLPRAKRVFARFLAGEEVQAEEIEFARADGTLFWGAVSIKPIRNADGDVEATRSIIVDISSRKRIERALLHRIAMEELIAQISARFISIETREIDDAITEAVGQIGSFSGSDHAFVSLICEDGVSVQRTHEWYSAEATIRGGGPAIEDDIATAHILRQIGANRVLHVPDAGDTSSDARRLKSRIEEWCIRSLIYVPMTLGDRTLGFLGLETQIHDKVWSNEDIRLLRMMGESLVHALARRDTETRLQEAKVAAETANRAKSEFLANMSHELRTPLNGILGYTQILSQDPDVSESQRDGLDVIGRSGEHLLTLINDILDLSKIEAGKLEVQKSEFFLQSFLKDIADIAEIRASQKGLSFQFEVLSPLPERVIADERRLRQVLLNLIGNATKFTDRGKVILRAGCLDSGAGAERLCVEVEDTGIGIAPGDLAAIFQPFLQVGSSRHRIEGTGLGLAISNQLVHLMGGRLTVKSEPANGSIFRIELDVPTTWNQTISRPDAQPSILGQKGVGKRILIVDDQAVNRAVLAGLLEPIGFNLMEAVDGRDALEKFVAFRPDAVLMDLVMPIMDGFEATRRLRSLASADRVVVIALSASVFERNRQQSLDAGCDDFLQKPVKRQSLLQSLEKHLDIDWLFDESADDADAQIQIETGPTVGMSLPPEVDIRQIFEFARMGHVRGILDQIEALEQASVDYGAFAAHMRGMARDYDMKMIRDFLRPHLGD